MMSGKIEIQIELGAGTAFSIYLDLERVEESDVLKTKKEVKERQPKIANSLINKRVLLAEDHPLNAEIAIKLLMKAGAEVVWKENGKLVVDEFINSEVNGYDAIIMDIRMPVMDGIEATKVIRSQNRADAKYIPIIAMTANAYNEDVKALLNAGMNYHITKPINSQKFYETISRFCKK